GTTTTPRSTASSGSCTPVRSGGRCPERYGKWQSIYDRFVRWRRDGTLDAILRRLQMRLDQEGRIDWDLWCIDGTNVRASRSAADARRGTKTSRSSPRITRWAAV